MFDVPAGLPTDLWSIPDPLHRYQTIEVPLKFNGLPMLWCITYHTLGTLVVLGGVSGVLPRPQMKSPSVPDDPKKRFEKFQKNQKSIIFTGF